MSTMYPLNIDVVSDTICPWCYIGKKRLDAALRELESQVTFDAVRWRPFELNPSMPRDGIDRRVYRSTKFGSWARSQELDAQVEAAGQTVGLDFRHERIERTPNTLLSHLLVGLAGLRDRQDAVVEALFRAYFSEGRDIGRTDVLLELGVSAGLEGSEVEAVLADESLRRATSAESETLRHAGVSAVPTVILNGAILFSGAQPEAVMSSALREAAAQAAEGNGPRRDSRG